MINKYNQFLLEKVRQELLLEGSIMATTDFLDKMKEISKEDTKVGKIAREIYYLINDEEHVDEDDIKQNFFDVTKAKDLVSFLQNNKVPSDWNSWDDSVQALPYEVSGRSEMKIGRVIKYLSDLLGSKITGKELEEFVNIYKSTDVDEYIKFKLVKGMDITRYYSSSKYYSSSGSLGNSCMSEESNKTFKIYSKNEDKVQLLIYVDNNDEIHGRALVWKLDKSPCEAKYFMDRVYTNNGATEIKFKKFAEENNFLYKKIMDSHKDTAVNFIYNKKDVNGIIEIKLEGDFKSYPYLDTLVFLNKKKNMLSNISSKKCWILQDISGSKERCTECDGKCVVNHGKRKEICYYCSSGHKTLNKLNIKTDVNKLV
jgi:hypothetical protein